MNILILKTIGSSFSDCNPKELLIWAWRVSNFPSLLTKKKVSKYPTPSVSMKKESQTRNPILREKPILMGFVLQRKGTDGRMHIAVRWGRILATLFVLFIVGWISRCWRALWLL
jgi:hypothetical protein